MSSEQTPASAKPQDDLAGPRPRRLTYAAVLAGLEGLTVLVGGVWMLALGLTGEVDHRQQAVTGGVTLVILALLPLLAARGLLARRSWSRGPAVITQLMALPVSYSLIHADGVAIPAGIALAAVAIAALVLLVNGETTRALGIRGPGNAEK
ncbi:hypothetical protein C3489_09710 [Streptomyces sp. Ru71]|uniref:hypothetical protein n=1 Tax=Streptomyces sp. Ru71 TaxID=2080746 RepID=UPI000CDD54D5|nr:hypothetical protein [Streptomyces sp. Ru71]POX55579.1 hypothetical protein C3489_09710 [Streptomyces sp. Ru71]